MNAKLPRRGVIKRDLIRVDEHDAPLPAKARTTGGAHCAPAPRVRLLQLDEQTQAIEFTCSCGEVSLIEIQSAKKS